jgi:hypothetical protein
MSNVERLRRRKRWPTRPTSNAGLPRSKTHWPTRLTSNVATSRQNALRHQRNWRSPRSDITMRQQNRLRCWPRRRLPRSNIATRQPRRRKRRPTRPTSDVKQPRRKKRWRTRPTSDAGLPRVTKRWPTRLTSNVATSWPNALQLRRQKCLPRTSTTRMTMMLRGNLKRTPHLSLLALTLSCPKSKPWMTVLATGLHLVMRSLPRRTTKPQLQRCRPRHPQRPCYQPPTALLHIWARSYQILRGGLMQHLSSLHRRLNLWRSLDHWQLTANPGWYVAVHDLIVALANAIVLKQVLLLARGHRQQYFLRRQEQALVLAQVCHHTYLPQRQEQFLLPTRGRR